MEKAINIKVKDLAKWILVIAIALGLGAILGIVFTKPQLIGGILKQVSTNQTANTPEVETPKDEGTLCTNTIPYDNPPELTRALSLVSERWNTAPNAPTVRGSYKNCIHLIYKPHSEMGDAEGYFLFDKDSSPNDIRIYIDDTYKNYDDILTASLLKHELTHATILILALEGTPPPTCIENEVSAFYSQIIFLNNLNEEEWKSITYRLAQNPHLNTTYELTNYLVSLDTAAANQCGNDGDCFKTYVKNDLRGWISSNPYYQKQCSL